MTTPSSPSRRRRFLYRLLALGVPVVLGGGFVVFLLFRQGWLTMDQGRWSFQRPPLYLQEPGYELTGHRYLYDEQLGWRNIPHWHASTYGQPLTINAQGLRDRDASYAKPAGTKRILVLGDSYAWGYGVGDDVIFTEVLEERLRHRNPPWEVINAGVSGWGTDQEYLFLRSEGLRYAPDLVVVAFFIGNDIDNNLAATQYTLNKPVFVDARLTVANVPVPRPGQAVAADVLVQIARMNGIDLTVRILEAMRTATREQQCELVVMKFGVFLTPELAYTRLREQQFEQRLREVQPPLRYLDLDRVFQDRSLDAHALTAGVDDGHWNAFGHAQVAEALADFLEGEGLLGAVGG